MRTTCLFSPFWGERDPPLREKADCIAAIAECREPYRKKRRIFRSLQKYTANRSDNTGSEGGREEKFFADKTISSARKAYRYPSFWITPAEISCFFITALISVLFFRMVLVRATKTISQPHVMSGSISAAARMTLRARLR